MEQLVQILFTKNGKRKIGKRHMIAKPEAIEFMKQTFAVKIGEEE